MYLKTCFTVRQPRFPRIYCWDTLIYFYIHVTYTFVHQRIHISPRRKPLRFPPKFLPYGRIPMTVLLLETLRNTPYSFIMKAQCHRPTNIFPLTPYLVTPKIKIPKSYTRSCSHNLSLQLSITKFSFTNIYHKCLFVSVSILGDKIVFRY